MKKQKMIKSVIFIVVLLIPIIYSFFYLKSYWDPYGDLSEMKIAVVNLDKGLDGEKQGIEFVQGLKDAGTFNICETSIDDANEGMQKGEYYATITVPSNFSECLNSASQENKQIATITYSPNQATNYLATQIVNSAIKTIELNLEEKINSKVTETLANKLKEVPDSLQDVSNGAGQILNGSKDLNSGLEKLNDGTSTLANSYIEFDEGVNSAYEGSKELSEGITQAKEGVDTLSTGTESLNSAIIQINSGMDELTTQGTEGIQTLVNGIEQLNNGAKDLNNGVTTYVDGTSGLANGTIAYVNGTNSLVSNMNTYIDSTKSANEQVLALLQQIATAGVTSEDTNMKALASQAQLIINSNALQNLNTTGMQLKQGATSVTNSSDSLKTGANELLVSGNKIKQGSAVLYQGTQNLSIGASGLTKITDGITILKTALSQVQLGSKSLNNGVNTLKLGTATLTQGGTDLSNGLEKLSSGSGTIKTAVNTISEGTQSAYTGSSKLVDGAKDFNSSIDKGINDTKEQIKSLDGIEEFAKNPVNFETEPYGEVNSYGIAFTPLFLCIGLWVGVLMCYVVLYYDQQNRFNILGSDAKNKILQNAIYIILGAVQGIITGALLKIGLGYEIQNITLYYFASMLIGISFMSIIQFLIRNFGDVGKFLALIVLVLQLAASGGTFPIETINKAFQALTPYLPMTYSIKLLREILVPTAANFKGSYIGILLGITIIMVGITYTVDVLKKHKLEKNEK